MSDDPKAPALPSGTFCIIPWVQLFADELGMMRPCCMAIGKRELTNVDAEGRPHVVHAPAGLEAGWNSPFMKSLRLTMMRGERPAVCSRCFDEEDLSIRSYRQDANVSMARHVEAAVAATAADGAAPLELVTSADLRLGNLCNLKCRMCSPISTKLLIPEWAELFDVAPGDERLTSLERVDWFDSDAFWRNCEPLIPRLERLHFGGGEPLLISRMLDFLAKVVEAGRAPHVELSYVTNLTILPERVTALWPAFQKVKLVTSLDGVDALNTYIRYPSKWDRIDDNLRRLTREPERFNVTKITVNTTVQAYNVLRLPDLFEYLFAHEAPNLAPYPRLTLLQWPSPFSVRVLPADLKALAARRLADFTARWNGRWPIEGPDLDHFLEAIDGVVSHMQSDDRSEELAEFARRTRGFDRLRGQDVRDVLPELAPVFDTEVPAPGP